MLNSMCKLSSVADLNAARVAQVAFFTIPAPLNHPRQKGPRLSRERWILILRFPNFDFFRIREQIGRFDINIMNVSSSPYEVLTLPFLSSSFSCSAFPNASLYSQRFDTRARGKEFTRWSTKDKKTDFRVCKPWLIHHARLTGRIWCRGQRRRSPASSQRPAGQRSETLL